MKPPAAPEATCCGREHRGSRTPAVRARGGGTMIAGDGLTGHEAGVEVRFEMGDGLGHRDVDGRTGLGGAGLNGREAVVKLLLEKGAEPEPKDEHGRTPLWWAAEKGHEVM